MARTSISVEVANAGGLNPTSTQGIADGHFFDASANPLVRVTNSDAGPHSVTFQTPLTVSTADLAVAENTVAIPAGESRVFSKLNTPAFRQADGFVYIDYAAGEEEHFAVEITAA